MHLSLKKFKKPVKVLPIILFNISQTYHGISYCYTLGQFVGTIIQI